MSEGLDQADFDTRRKLLRLLIKRIEVDQDEVRIVYKVQPRPFATAPASGGFLQDCLKFAGKPFGLDIPKGSRSNPKHEIRNPKQIQEKEIQMIKTSA